MKASELIKLLEAFIKTDGDLNVGYHNSEFSSFESVSTVKVRNKSKANRLTYADDDEELGIKFIGIQ